jgi:acyl dehydratase
MTRLDTSELEARVGQPVAGPQLKEPVSTFDIRRWAHGLQNPNPIHFDEDAAVGSVFGRIVAPQSFTAACDVGMGALPALVGVIPGSRALFVQDEWWFFGPRIYPGDRIAVERMARDYRVEDTAAVGPGVVQRGDTTYINHAGEVIGTQRATAIRFSAENAFAGAEGPTWTDDRLEQVERERFAYYDTFGERRPPSVVSVRDELPRRVIGPHSEASFATEWRAYPFTIWGTAAPDLEDGWADTTGARGARRASHLSDRWASALGIPRGLGFGASMGAWVLDYVANWAGETAFITHSAVEYRLPAFAGDVTYLDGLVSAIEGCVTVEVVLTNQDGTRIAEGTVDVRLGGVG